MIGKIQRVPLREVWKHEALDLTCWLEENIDVISEQIGTPLSSAEREKGAGNFWVDLVAEDADGATVIIENQLERSDHDHLGKRITYLVAMDAKTAIWITPDPRPEHIAAVNWLNESTPASFFLFKLEAVRIGDSMPAPLLTRIVGPTPEGRAIGMKKMDMAGRVAEVYRFWTAFLEYAKERLPLFNGIQPAKTHFIQKTAGVSGLYYVFSTSKGEVNVELYIDRGNEDENLGILHQLMAKREEIETVYGGSLDWQELEGRRACRVRTTITTGGYASEEKAWPALFAEMVDRMNRTEKALASHVRVLKVGAASRVERAGAPFSGERTRSTGSRQ